MSELDTKDQKQTGNDVADGTVGSEVEVFLDVIMRHQIQENSLAITSLQRRCFNTAHLMSKATIIV